MIKTTENVQNRRLY